MKEQEVTRLIEIAATQAAPFVIDASAGPVRVLATIDGVDPATLENGCEYQKAETDVLLRWFAHWLLRKYFLETGDPRFDHRLEHWRAPAGFKEVVRTIRRGVLDDLNTQFRTVLRTSEKPK